MEDEFLNRVLDLYRADDWMSLLDLNRDSDNKNALKLLWVWPSEKNLRFIEKIIIEEYHCRGITSIGCGCGLLEWIINRALGIHVKGYEINREWWDSKYSIPAFIQLNFWKQNDVTLDPEYALLFCYFNDGEAFLEYIQLYRGQVVIVIGPGKFKGHHTDPEPFKANFGSMEWHLNDYQEVKDSKDFIAVYTRHK